MDRGGAGTGEARGEARGEGEWLRAYGRLAAMVPRVEALAAGRARLEAINGIQHEFWEARDVLLQCRLLQADQSRRRWEAAYLDLQHSSDDRRFPELQNSDLEDLQTFVDVLDAENKEFKIEVKEVEGGAEHCQNAADHEHIAGDLKAVLGQLKQAYEALCSEKDKEVSALIAEKDKEVSALIAEKDFVREQVRTLERDYADLRSYSSKQAAQVTEAKQELEQLQVASQKKDDDIRKLRARAKAVDAKGNSVPEDKLQETSCMPRETFGEIEKWKDRQPETSQKSKKVMSETHNKNCSEGPALRREETKNSSSKQMLAKDGQPQTSQKRKCITFLSNDIEQNASDEETSNQVLEPLKKKRVLGEGEVEQDDSKAKLANGKGDVEQDDSKAINLPVIKTVVPVVSKAATSTDSQDSEQTMIRDWKQVEADAATSKGAREVIPVEDDEEIEERMHMDADPPSPKRNLTVADVTDDIVPKIPEVSLDLNTQATTDVTLADPSTLAIAMSQPAPVPAASSTLYPLSRTPENEVGAGKEAMIQTELMNKRLKEAYDSSEVPKANIRKACELGTKHVALEEEVKKLRAELAEERKKSAKLEQEKKIMGESTKKALEDKDTELAKAWENANAKTKKAEDNLKEFQKMKKLNDTLTKAVDGMKKEIEELKKSYSEWDKKYQELSEDSSQSQKKLEEKVSDLAKKKTGLEDFVENEVELINQKLGGFCSDTEEEMERIQQELTPEKLIIRDSTTLSLLRLDERVETAMKYILRMKEAMKKVDDILCPGEEFDDDFEAYLTRLKEIPDRVKEWKKSAALCGADVALALVQVHFPKTNEKKLQALSVVNPKGRDFQQFLSTFIEAATRIADAIDLNVFIDPVGPVE